jgi:hypothetical protein
VREGSDETSSADSIVTGLRRPGARPPLPSSHGNRGAPTPEAIFAALRAVTVRDMKVAWLLGELRHLPARLAGRLPAAPPPDRPFLDTLADGPIVLRDDPPRELITGLAAQLHRVHQAPRHFADAASFEAFDDPGHEKLIVGHPAGWRSAASMRPTRA